jgi:hypothetical protein
LASIDLPMSGSLTLNVVDNTVQDIEGSFPEIWAFAQNAVILSLMTLQNHVIVAGTDISNTN